MHASCEEDAEAGRYFRRTGMLLCLLYALQATDCHNENLIACGEHPVLIDAETLMHHRARDVAEQGANRGTDALYQAYERMWDSVLTSGMLPQWQFGADGRNAYDMTGLGGVGEQSSPFLARHWTNLNTDAMAREVVQPTMTSQANAASLRGEPLAPNDYVEDLVAGFETMYAFLEQHQEALLDAEGPLTVLAHQRVRFVFRATEVYAFVQHKLLQPRFLREGVDYAIGMELCARAMLGPTTSAGGSGS